MMKKLLAITACAIAFTAAPAFAEEGGPQGKHHKGKMFEKHDTNGDGVISKDEFLSDAEKRFSEMDADGSGDITQEEAKAAFEKMREKMKGMKGKYRDRKPPVEAPGE